MSKIIEVFRKIGCLLLSAILFFIMCFYLVLDLVPKIVVKDNANVLINELTTEQLIYNGENTMIDNLEKLVVENGLDRSIISKILNQDNFKSLIVNYYGEMTETILYNKKEPKLDSKDIVNTLKQNVQNSFDDLGIILSEEEQELIIEYLNNNSEKIIEIIPNYDQVVGMIGSENVDSLRLLFGMTGKILLIVIMVLVVALIALVSWSIYKFAVWSGATIIISSLVIMISGSLIYDILLNYTNVVISQPIKNLIENNILKVVTSTGTTVIIIGAVQILYYYLLRKRASQKY